MSRAARLFDLLQLLRRHRRPVVAALLAEELGVSKRTVYRDIETLIALGAPIAGEAGVGFLLRPGFLLPPLMFTEEELEALALGGGWVVQQGDGALATAAKDALAKIAAVLPLPLSARLDDPGLRAVLPAPPIEGAVDPAIVRAAIRRERKLRIVYADESGQRSERTVWPIALVYFQATRLLAAWCELRDGFRHFRLDRIADAAVLDMRYPQNRAALTKAWRAHDEAAGRRPPRPAARN
jgi:predicted DNA-binding transcriptional regulator YafY